MTRQPGDTVTAPFYLPEGPEGSLCPEGHAKGPVAKDAARLSDLADNGARPRDFVASLAKGIVVLRAFEIGAPQKTLSEVAELTGFSRAGARRLLLTLVTLGYVRQEARYFSLTARVLEIGYGFLGSNRWIEFAMARLLKLSERFHDPCGIGILSREEVILVAHAPARRLTELSLTTGARQPALYTSLGRIQLGMLDPAELAGMIEQAALSAHTDYSITDPEALKIRIHEDWAQGYSLVDRELDPGLSTIAVPLRNARGTVIAAIAMGTSPENQVEDRLTNSCLPALQETANELSYMIY